MANSKLLLSVDDLSHKLLSIETEVAVGETFDLILDGLAGVSTGSKVVVGLYSLSGGLLWTLDSPLSLIDDTHYGVANCTINTQEAAKVVRLTSAVTILTLVIHAEDGKQTVYGSAYLRLHQGYAEDGGSVGKAITSLEQHNTDETAHPAIRKLVGELRLEVLRIIDETMLQHGNSEVEARTQAISHAIRQLDAELTNRYKGDLTFFATACAASSKAAAASAKVSAEASKLTVDKLGEANKVVEELGNSLTEAGEKLEDINRAIKDANDVASSLEKSRDLIVNAKDTVVNKVKEFNTTLETFNGEFAQDKQTIKDGVTAVTNAKDDFDAKWPTIEKVEGSAKGVAEAEGRITEAEGRVNTTVNEVLPAKVTEINANLDQKQTAIVANIDAKATSVNTALDGKLATAQTAINDAVGKAETAKGDAVKAQEQAQGFATQASTSASNAATSETNAKTAEANAKASAVQAENATALKVDQRINTADDSPYPLIVRVDKDVYKLVAPQDASNSWHYCCDGVAHYFAQYPSKLYVYDKSLKFSEALSVVYGESISGAYLNLKDFCTKIGDNYFIRWNGYPYKVHKIRKYDKSGTYVDEVVIDGIGAYNGFTRVARNERTNHLLIFSNYPDGAGYRIYDEDLKFLGEKRIDAKIESGDNWLRHLNIVGGITMVSFAPTDATKTALFILDENDNIQEVTAVTIRGSGAFTSEDLTASGRTFAKYFIPRMFYDQRQSHDGSGAGLNHHHVVEVTNGAKWYRLYIDFNEDTLGEVAVNQGQTKAITSSSVPQTKYGEDTLFVANGSGSNNGESTYSQPVINLTSSGILTKVADLYGARGGYTEFAPDPFASIAIFGRRVIGNTRVARNDAATPRDYNLYPANNGAVMFTP